MANRYIRKKCPMYNEKKNTEDAQKHPNQNSRKNTYNTSKKHQETKTNPKTTKKNHSHLLINDQNQK